MADSPFDTLMQVSMGFTLPRTLHVIAELGIAGALDDTPLSAKALAAATGTDADALNRAIRLLCAHGIFERQADGYGHTPASWLLRSDHPQSMRSFVRMQGIPALWHIWEHFDHSLRTGRSAAEKTLPDGGFWGYFTDNPEHSRLFNDAMTAKTHGQTAGIPRRTISHISIVSQTLAAGMATCFRQYCRRPQISRECCLTYRTSSSKPRRFVQSG